MRRRVTVTSGAGNPCARRTRPDLLIQRSSVPEGLGTIAAVRKKSPWQRVRHRLRIAQTAGAGGTGVASTIDMPAALRVWTRCENRLSLLPFPVTAWVAVPQQAA